jgi:GNAT superfamily N-acetyltransferase
MVAPVDLRVTAVADAVLVAGADQVAPLAEVLARVFDDDPVSQWIFPGPRRRPAGLRAWFRIQVRDQLPFGGVYAMADRTGAAVWTPPGRPVPTGAAALAHLLPVGPYVLGTLVRTLRFLGEIEQARPTEPHWYLDTVGVVEAVRGHGVGAALLEPVLTHCDAEGTGAYLESSKRRNLPFYRRHGFTVVAELGGRAAPPVWGMWRDPAPPGR